MIAATDPAFERLFTERYEQAKRASSSLAGPSLAQRLAALPRPAFERVLGELSRAERARMLHTWPFWA